MTHRHSEYPKNPEQGAYCVYWIPQIPMPPFRRSVSSLDEAVKLLETLAFYDTFQFEMNVKGDYSNAGGLEIFEGGEWQEWESEEGLNIDEWADEVRALNTLPEVFKGDES